MHLVIVESPAKAKTIQKYLGAGFEVLASFGHVRDLPSKDGSVRPDEDFAMTYEIDASSQRHVSALVAAAKSADTLSLATDPDREGEAISWHILETLREKRALMKNVKIQRVVFEEITKRAVTEAFTHPREIDMNLVNAQQARRALDYLVGFTLSPVLWRKLPGSRSAGRVQSVALRLICERDEEIERFNSREYWDIRAQFRTDSGAFVNTKLWELNGEKLDKFAITNAARAQEVVQQLQGKSYAVASLDPKQVRRHPAPPFTTSTIQQEAARKYGFSAKHTMQIAQKLYEGITLDGETTGLITYMRTDAVTVSTEAVNAARSFLAKRFGANYVPQAPRVYKTKSKNAQEAHEAIRPTDVTRAPDQIAKFLDPDQLKLYDLVWKRMLASQMESAVMDQMTVDITAADKKAVLRATGSTIRFDGFLALYQEGVDDSEDDEAQTLPALQPNQPLHTNTIEPLQHFTQPPPRYSEASLVKKLEELGIGRPSTYASILSVLQERGYVQLDKKRFIAEQLGRVVNAFLVSFFERYVEYGFTAALEDQLDDISAGSRDWKAVLRDFWNDFFARIEESRNLPMPQVMEAIDRMLTHYAFGPDVEGVNAKLCPSCGGTLGVRWGKFGAYITCNKYPDCTYRRQIGQNGGEAGDAKTEPQLLGAHPQSGEPISLRKGPYGWYVQLGENPVVEKKPKAKATKGKAKEAVKEKAKTAKRSGLLKSMSPETLTLDDALALLSLPRELGLHPETHLPIIANVGKFGPYLLHDGKFTTLPASEDVLTIGINRAVTVLSEAKPKGGRGAAQREVMHNLGAHPDGGEIVILKGRYGPYITSGKVNAPIPRGREPETVTPAEAIEWLAARQGMEKKKPFRKTAAKTTKSSAKTGAKKARSS